VQMREELERRDRILSAVSTVAQTLVRSKEWEPIIPECLELLGQAAGVEQAILFGMNLSHRSGFEEYYGEWTLPDIRDDIAATPDLCTTILSSLFRYLEKNRFYIADKETLTEELSTSWKHPIPSFVFLLPVFI